VTRRRASATLAGVIGETGDALVVRRSVEDDVEPWLDLLTAVASGGQWIATEVPFDREARRARFLEQLVAKNAASFVAVAGNRLAGSLGVRLNSGVAELGLFVAAESRTSGVGSALMRECVDWAQEAGAHKLTLTVFPHNHGARALYSKFGFVTEGRFRRAMRRSSGELWDVISMGLVLETTSPGRRLDREAGDGCQPRLVPIVLQARWHREGLVLRPGEFCDAGNLAAAIDDPEVHRWLEMLPDPYTLEDARSFLAQARQEWTDGAGAPFVMTSDGDLAGGIGLRIDPRVPGVGEVGYWVARPARGQGVATAAVKAVVDWAFTVVGLSRIELHAAVDNVASRAVAERAGFEQEGIKRSWRSIRGVRADFVLYARLAKRSS
jgi:RimJ/RimL family protein N-acetyltransferase